jgi:hypothetical protein
MRQVRDLIIGFLLAISLLNSLSIQCQNLILNPSFENAYSDYCFPQTFPESYSIYAEGWTSPTAATPDVFSTKIGNKSCYSAMPWIGIETDPDESHPGNQLPRTGSRFAGIISYSSLPGVKNYREYIQTELSIPLVVGKYYCFKMYVSRGEFTKYAINNLGVYFGDFIPLKYNFRTNLALNPQILFKQVLINGTDWVELSATIRATTPATSMIIGNFSPDEDLIIQEPPGGIPNKSSFFSAYYFIDDVSLELVPDPYQLTFAGSNVVCENSKTSLSLDGQYDYVTWSDYADTTKILVTGNYLNIKQTATTKYYLRARKCGLEIRDTVSIKTLPIPKVDLGRDTTICVNTQLMLSSGTVGIAYEWQDKSTQSDFTVTKAGIYSLQVLNTYFCTNSDTIQVSVRNLPLANLGEDLLVCNEFPQLTANNGDSYLWSTGSNDAEFHPDQAGTYWVQITNQCGVSRDTLRIYSFKDLFIPNVVTLNQDTLNAKLTFRGIGNFYTSSLHIVDRWGNEIYTNSNYHGSWPTPEEEVPEGTYYYLVDFPGCRSYKGWLRVIR